MYFSLIDWFETVQSVRTVCASESLMTGPGEDLFDFMADKLKEFMVSHHHDHHHYYHHHCDPHLVCAHAAVVRALGSGEAVLGPAEGVTVLVQQSVLL